MLIPHEFNIGEIYMPPEFIAWILGTIAASITAKLLNKYRLSKYLFYPPLVFVALSVIYTLLIGWTFVPF